jgi:uncharacterized protein with NAD-binding domain and iron-sulfur cluster
LRRGRLPAPFHFAGAFLKMKCLDAGDKLAIARVLWAIRRERTRRQDLDKISMRDWLLQKRQTPRAIDRFWRQVLVSAVNEDLDRMAARHGFQVFWLGFLARADGYEMGVPAVPLGELYGTDAWQRLPSVRMHFRAPVEAIEAAAGGRASRAAVRAFAHHRRPPLVRPRNHHAAPCHAARPHHAMDVQQGWRALPATGGERFTRPDQLVAGGHH